MSFGKTSQLNNIGFGCMSLNPNDSSSKNILIKAVENGIELFDTADLYNHGKNEEIVGEALSTFRQKVKIATKVGNEWNNSGTDWRWNPSKEYILKAVDNSLRRLKTDYIDLYMLHGGTIEDPIDESVEAFEMLKSRGKILEYGISSIRPKVIREWIKRSNISSVMMQYSLLDRRPEEECLNLLAKHNISVLARGVLAKGMLIDKPAKEYLGYSEAEVQKVQTAVSETENSLAATIQYVQKSKADVKPIVGIRTLDQLNEMIKAQSVSISDTELTQLASVLEANVYEKHR